jgi:two-component system nitrogen regulation sensor histidine kinase NtrY
MSLRQALLRHRKDQRLIVGALALLLLLFTTTFWLSLRERDLPALLVTNRILLFVLWYVNVVLILVVVFVLLRNVFKLLIERHHRVLGSTFKFKLVASYIGMSLIPVLALFAIATELLQGSIDRWFNTPVRPVLERGSAVAMALYDRIEQQNLRDAARVLRESAGTDLRGPAERQRLARLLAELHLDVLSVYQGSEFVQSVANSQTLRDLPRPRRDFLEEAAAEGEATLIDTEPGVAGKLVWAAVTAGGARGGGSGRGGGGPGGAAGGAARGAPAGEAAAAAPAMVVAATLLDRGLAERTTRLIEDFQGYRQLEVEKDDLRASHLLIFLMVTLVILLASSWVGLYLARRVTVPIQALAEGTRRISGGDLHHRVDVQADDELGVLVGSFNRMTEELLSNKEQLERGNRELSDSNQRLAAERALIAAVLQSVAAGVVSIDSEGRIFTCNEAALRLLRQREADVVGRPCAEAWTDPERHKLAVLAAAPRPRSTCCWAATGRPSRPR